MKLIIGLGNPGERYKNNRHNAGYLLVDLLKKKGVPEGVVVKQTGVLMNSSGPAVRKLADYYKVERNDIFIVFDDLDLSLGKYKIVKGSGPKDHNGLNSIYDSLGKSDFWHVRIGVDSREGKPIEGQEYVLQDFGRQEREQLEKVFKRISKELDEKIKK